MTSRKAVASSAARARGRRAGLVVFGVLVTTFTAVCTVQIVRQVWFPVVPTAEADCRPGVHDLIESVRRARTAADAEHGGERARLRRFRAHLAAAWSKRDALERVCAGDARALSALEVIDRYRYAEEHALRAETFDLAERRGEVAVVEAQLYSGAGE